MPDLIDYLHDLIDRPPEPLGLAPYTAKAFISEIAFHAKHDEEIGKWIESFFGAFKLLIDEIESVGANAETTRRMQAALHAFADLIAKFSQATGTVH